MGIRDRIRNRLQGYRVDLTTKNRYSDKTLKKLKKVAVVGGGIAGISAAANLAERGFQVQLFESQSFIGGKVGSWTFESQGKTLRTEHGFHAFFRQYYNLREFLARIGAAHHLMPIDDYIILFDKDKKQGFQGLEPTPGLNILALKKRGIFNNLTMINPLSASFLNLLRFDFSKTYKKFDGESFAQFSKRTFMPKKMKLVFNSFSRAFFAEPEDMSMAELIKSFHFYFLSNEDGLLYDVLDDDFENSFLKYCRNFIERNGGRIHLSKPVNSIELKEHQFEIDSQLFDYAVLCTDVKATKKIVGNSPTLYNVGNTAEQISKLKSSGYYAVYRIWTDKFEADQQLPFFIFTDRLECLDSVTLYHKMEKESKTWSQENNGGIFELHSYILPKHLNDSAAIKSQMMTELYHYFPELTGLSICHEYFQYRNDFPGFHTNQYKDRPTIKTDIPNFYLAGDWVKMDNCTMLMEAAYTSGAIAANHIMEKEQLQINRLTSVPKKGLLA